MHILLFDMDHVLVEPIAYRKALQETTAMIGRSLGYVRAPVLVQDIEAFETLGVTSEWDSAAICAALLLRDVWLAGMDYPLPERLPLEPMGRHTLPGPDIQAFLRSESMQQALERPGLERAEQALCCEAAGLADWQAEAIRCLLRGARRMDGAITHRLFQELVLGGDAFRSTYGIEPCIGGEGFIHRYDRPLLSSDTAAKLRSWLGQEDHAAAVFTNRPSAAPDGSRGWPPEAEMGLQAAGLEGIPIAGLGGMQWLAKNRGLEPEALIKPSPVHALSALRIAIGTPLNSALEGALDLESGGRRNPAWAQVHGAQVTVFEDSARGLLSASGAQDKLAEVGVELHLSLMGIARGAEKKAALHSAGGRVYASTDEALAAVVGPRSRA